jgi:N-acetylneuraminate synthase
MSANHGGSLDKALDIIEAAKASGADAIKFQTFDPTKMVVDHKYVIEHGIWAGWKLVDLYKKAHTPYEWHEKLFRHAAACGIIPMSSPFSKEDVDFLETMNCPIYKVASYELVDLNLIRHIAKTKKPILLSTGMATVNEIELAVLAAQPSHVCLLKCTSQYPADASQANLSSFRALLPLCRNYGCSIGISDHTPGIGVSVASVMMGVSVVEKHFTLSREDMTLDSTFSMEPQEFKQLVEECGRAHQAYGSDKWPTQIEPGLRRSLWFSRSIKKGSVLMEEDFVTARPGVGLSPTMLPNIIGKRLNCDVEKFDPMTLDCI